MKELEAKYKSKFRNKLKWYKQDQNNPLLKCIIDDFDSTISDAFQELENRSCSNCEHYKQSSHHVYKTCFLIKTNGFNLESNIDFYCNKWKNKD